MFKFFASIAGLVATVVKYIVSLFAMLLNLVVQTIRALAYVALVISWLPAYLKVFVVAMVGVSVALFVINRSD